MVDKEGYRLKTHQAILKRTDLTLLAPAGDIKQTGLTIHVDSPEDSLVR